MKKFLLMLIVLAMSMPAWAQTWSKDLEKSAKSGDQAAQLAVAKAYLNGDGVEKSLGKSAKWLYLATKSGNKEAEQLLLSFYSKDLEKYAKEGDAQAQYEVGMDYFAGTEIAKNTETAAKWFNLAQAQGHKEAREKFLSFYSKELEKVAKAGDAQAQYEVGMDYFAGTEIAKNTETAAKWFNLAQAQGHKEAREKFLSFYSKELEKVAKAGDAQAQYEVGMDYFAGTEIAKNTETAAKWFSLAQAQGHKEAREKFLSFYSKELETVAKAGDAQAQFCTGEFFYNGNGVAKDVKVAAKWYDMAVAQNHEGAKKSLCGFYSKELENRVKNDGDSELQYYLGLCYQKGIEVKPNAEKAAKLFEASMNQGNKEAAKAFFTCDSKYQSKVVKTYQVNPTIQYYGYLKSGKVGEWEEANSYKAEINIAPWQTKTPYITISGEKTGNQYSNATVSSKAMGFSFKGDAQLGIQKQNGVELIVLILQKGGSLSLESQTTKLEKYLAIFLLDTGYQIQPYLGQSEEPENTGNCLKNVSLNDIMPSLNITSEQSNAIKNILKLYSADSVKCDVIGGYIISDNSHKLKLAYTFDEKSYTNDQQLPDSVARNKDKFYISGDEFVFLSKNGHDKIVWNDNCIISLTKGYNDGVANYINGKPSTIKLGRKGEFTGLYHLGNLYAKNKIRDFSKIVNLWNSNNISTLDFVIVEGDYTDANGVSVHWLEGRTETDHKKLVQSLKEMTARAIANRIASLKEARDNAIKQLIAEGFNETDVNTLLNRCTVAKGMHRRLIRRAHELNSNLKIEMDCTLDGSPRQLIKIYNANTGELYFYQFVGYHYIFDTVRVIENL